MPADRSAPPGAEDRGEKGLGCAYWPSPFSCAFSHKHVLRRTCGGVPANKGKALHRECQARPFRGQARSHRYGGGRTCSLHLENDNALHISDAARAVQVPAQLFNCAGAQRTRLASAAAPPCGSGFTREQGRSTCPPQRVSGPDFSRAMLTQPPARASSAGPCHRRWPAAPSDGGQPCAWPRPSCRLSSRLSSS